MGEGKQSTERHKWQVRLGSAIGILGAHWQFSASCYKTPSGCKSFYYSCSRGKCLGIGAHRGRLLFWGAMQACFQGSAVYAGVPGAGLVPNSTRIKATFALMAAAIGKRFREMSWGNRYLSPQEVWLLSEEIYFQATFGKLLKLVHSILLICKVGKD